MPGLFYTPVDMLWCFTQASSLHEVCRLCRPLSSSKGNSGQ
jgi:hypothetical protein